MDHKSHVLEPSRPKSHRPSSSRSATPQFPNPQTNQRQEKGTTKVDPDEVQEQICLTLFATLSLLTNPDNTIRTDFHTTALPRATLLVSKTTVNPDRVREAGEREAARFLERYARARELKEIEEKARTVLEVVRGLREEDEDGVDSMLITNGTTARHGSEGDGSVVMEGEEQDSDGVELLELFRGGGKSQNERGNGARRRSTRSGTCAKRKAAEETLFNTAKEIMTTAKKIKESHGRRESDAGMLKE